MLEKDKSIYDSRDRIIARKPFSMNGWKNIVRDQGETLVQAKVSIACLNDSQVENKSTEYHDRSDTMGHKRENAEDFSSEEVDGDQLGYISSVQVKLTEKMQGNRKPSRIGTLSRNFDDNAMLSMEDPKTIEKGMQSEEASH